MALMSSEKQPKRVSGSTTDSGGRSLNSRQVEWIKLCRMAYESLKSVVVCNGISAVRLDLDTQDESNTCAVQVSLHDSGLASKLLCTSFFDTDHHMIRFTDKTLGSEHPFPEMTSASDNISGSHGQNDLQPARSVAPTGVDVIDAFLRKEKRQSRWVVSTGNALIIGDTPMARWEGEDVQFKSPGPAAEDAEVLETLRMLIKLEKHKQKV